MHEGSNLKNSQKELKRDKETFSDKPPNEINAINQHRSPSNATLSLENNPWGEGESHVNQVPHSHASDDIS